MITRRRLLWIILPVALGVILLSALFVGVSQASEMKLFAIDRRVNTIFHDDSVIVIGVAADLSGPGIELGWQQTNSIQLAVDQLNSTGGIDIAGTSYTLTLVVADSGCNPTQAVTAANTLLNAGVVAVIGHSCSGASLAAQPIYNAAGVTMLSASSTSPLITQGGYTTTFRNVPHDGTTANLLAEHFRSNLGLLNSAIIETEWWQSPGDVYSDTFRLLGGDITGRHVITDTANFTSVLTTIQAENPDVIVEFYSVGNPSQGGQLNLIAHNLGMTEVIFGWNAESNDEAVLDDYVSVGGIAVENDYAVMKLRRLADMPGWETFITDYEAADFPQGPNSPDIFAASAYDAAHIIVAAIEGANSTDPIAIRDAVSAMEYHDGIVGTYQGFDNNGDVIPQWGWLMHYYNGEWVDVRSSVTNTIGTTGGSISSVDGDVRLTFSPESISETAVMTYTDMLMPTSPPPAVFSFAGNAFSLEAISTSDGQPITSLQQPVTVTIRYTEQGLNGQDENALTLLYWNGIEWDNDGIAIIERDSDMNRFVTTIGHLSEFALFSQNRLYLPTVMKLTEKRK